MTGDHEYALTINNIRISRPTNQLERLLHFYCDGLGLSHVLSFSEDAAGYSGVVLGLPGQPFHLELCSHRQGFANCRPPTPDNLLVLYIQTPANFERIERRMRELGYPAQPATNPHWDQDGITFEDPDGWRVVLMLRNNV